MGTTSVFEHIQPSLKRIPRSWHKHEGPWKSRYCVVWILGHVSFQREFHPLWSILWLSACSISKCFVEDAASGFIMRDSEEEAVASPMSPRKEYLGACFLSVQAPSPLFAPRQHFLWNQTTGSCPKFYQMITSWKAHCDCMSWASSSRFCEAEGSCWWHNSDYSSFSPPVKTKQQFCRSSLKLMTAS